MLKKYCEECQRYSYSTSDSGQWRCPSCGADLTEAPSQLVMEQYLSNKEGEDPRGCQSNFF